MSNDSKTGAKVSTALTTVTPTEVMPIARQMSGALDIQAVMVENPEIAAEIKRNVISATIACGGDPEAIKAYKRAMIKGLAGDMVKTLRKLADSAK